jgi:putative DNA primase/helicase
MTTAQEILQQNKIPYVSNKKGAYTTNCPNCSGGYLNVKIDKNGVQWFCQNCEKSGGEYFEPRSNGSTSSKLGPVKATYDYTDEQGNLLFQSLRFEPLNGPKKFLQRTGPDQKKWNIKDVRIVPYRLSELIENIAAGRLVLVVEGEKDVENCRARGIPATCNPMGAEKWWDEFNPIFDGANVIICGDNDEPGRRHVELVARNLQGRARRIRVLDLKQFWPEIEPSADISDWFDAGGTPERLWEIVDQLTDYADPQAQADANTQQPDQNEDAEDAEIARLAKLSPLEYGKQRKAAADKLGTGVTFLDKAVSLKRAELGLNEKEDTKQGRPMTFTDPEPWPDPVDGAELLNNISAAILRYMVMAKHHADICALWTVLTYLVWEFWIVPRLFIHSPTLQCGKSTLMGILKCLVLRPLKTDNITVASIFRLVEKWHPTVLLDEFDTYFKGESAEQMRGLLDSGYAQDGEFIRTVGDDFEPRAFSTFAATVIAQIGELHGTVASRAIRVELKRKTKNEKVEDFSPFEVGHLKVLARKAARWAKDNAQAVRDAKPEMDAVLNRNRDNVRPLLAIADLAGDAWGKRARDAITANLASVEVDEGSLLEQLLWDIKDIFDDSGQERIASEDLVARLIENEGRPWAELGKSRKPLTQARLARMLGVKGVAITPTKGLTTRLDDALDAKGNPLVDAAGYPLVQNVRAYDRSQFDDAFSRFPTPKVEKRKNVDGSKENSTFQSGNADPNFHFENSEKPNNGGDISSFPLSTGETRKRGEFLTRGATPAPTQTVGQTATTEEQRTMSNDPLRFFAVVERDGKTGYAVEFYPEERRRYAWQYRNRIVGEFNTALEATAAVMAEMKRRRRHA